MPRVISHSDVEAAGAGGTLLVEPDALVTPLAAEQARTLGVTLARGGAQSPSVIRQVTRSVVARLGDASPEVLEAVVAEVLGALQQPDAPRLEEVGPGIDYCQMCVEQERARART